MRLLPWVLAGGMLFNGCESSDNAGKTKVMVDLGGCYMVQYMDKHPYDGEPDSVFVISTNEFSKDKDFCGDYLGISEGGKTFGPGDAEFEFYKHEFKNRFPSYVYRRKAIMEKRSQR
jgi:hypothetical protein